MIFSAGRTFELQVHEIMKLGDLKNGIHSLEGISTPYPGTGAETRPSRARETATKLRDIAFKIIKNTNEVRKS